MLSIVRVVAKLHWGYSVKHPIYSASQPCLRYPPPTTLLGALAYAIAREEGIEVRLEGSTLYSYATQLLSVVPWTTYRFLDVDPSVLIETRDISRVLMAPYTRSDNVYPGSIYVWAVQTHGKIYAPCTTLEILYIVRSDALDKISRAAWGITRLGTRESIVSVQLVEPLEAETVENNVVETSFGFPRSLATPVEGSFVESRLSIPSRDWYALGIVRDVGRYLEDFVIPINTVKAKLSGRGTALRIGKPGLYVVIPREVAKLG